MSRTMNNITIVCYDITSDKLRRRIDKCMKDFGIRIQFSVFLCRSEADVIKRCRAKLLRILKQFSHESVPGDSIIVFSRLSPNSVECLLGTKIEHDAPPFLVV